MDNNHQYIRIACSCCGMTRDVPKYCGNRFCDVCSGSRRLRLRERLEALTRAVPKRERYRWRFLTLTIPRQSDPAIGLDTVYASFRRLRQRKWWKERVSGGIVVAELTKNESGWNVHLHVLVYSQYLPQFHIVKLWRQVSPGKIVDIRLVDSKKAIGYITKYVSKLSVPEEAQEVAARALNSRRLYSAFGVCHNIRVDARPVPFCCPNCSSSSWIRLDEVLYTKGQVVDSFT